eukprot:sb/3470565/
MQAIDWQRFSCVSDGLQIEKLVTEFGGNPAVGKYKKILWKHIRATRAVTKIWVKEINDVVRGNLTTDEKLETLQICKELSVRQVEIKKHTSPYVCVMTYDYPLKLGFEIARGEINEGTLANVKNDIRDDAHYHLVVDATAQLAHELKRSAESGRQKKVIKRLMKRHTIRSETTRSSNTPRESSDRILANYNQRRELCWVTER